LPSDRISLESVHVESLSLYNNVGIGREVFSVAAASHTLRHVI
jgi:hypothetical protein